MIEFHRKSGESDQAAKPARRKAGGFSQSNFQYRTLLGEATPVVRKEAIPIS